MLFPCVFFFSFLFIVFIFVSCNKQEQVTKSRKVDEFGNL